MWALCEEVGFARSMLAYELADGRLKLLDGHLRRNLDPDMEVGRFGSWNLFPSMGHR